MRLDDGAGDVEAQPKPAEPTLRDVAIRLNEQVEDALTQVLGNPDPLVRHAQLDLVADASRGDCDRTAFQRILVRVLGEVVEELTCVIAPRVAATMCMTGT